MEQLRFNPMDPAFVQDPYPVYARLRQEAPYLRSHGARVLTRYSDVRAALQDRRLSVGAIPAALERGARRLRIGCTGMVEQFIRNAIVFTDAPLHARLRRPAMQAFTTQALRQFTSLLDAQIAACLHSWRDGETIDFVSRYARPLPLLALCEWLGVTCTEHATIAKRIHVLRRLLDPGLMTAPQYAEVVDTFAAFMEMLLTLPDTRADGMPTLGGQLKAASDGGDRLKPEEVAFISAMAVLAGTETTECLITNMLHSLLTHPGQEALVRAQPAEAAAAAVEETLRYQAPLPLTRRTVVESTTINGQPLEEGEQLLLCLASANRDEHTFANPDRFDIERRGQPHFGFGFGIHLCIGASLARMEAQRTLLQLLRRFRAIELAEPDVEWQPHSMILRGPKALWVRGHASGAAAN